MEKGVENLKSSTGTGFSHLFPLLKKLDFRGDAPHKSMKNQRKNRFSTGSFSTREHSFVRKSRIFTIFLKIFPILFFSTGSVFPNFHTHAREKIYPQNEKSFPYAFPFFFAEKQEAEKSVPARHFRVFPRFNGDYSYYRYHI